MSNEMTIMHKLLVTRSKGQSAASYSISGTILSGGSGLAGVTVTLGARSTTTASDGTFSLTGVPSGTSGALTPTKTDYYFSPASIAISSLGADETGKDFTGITYTLLDRFTSGDASSPRTCTPGPGTLTLGDSNQFTVADGLLKLTGTVTYARSGLLTRSTGLAFGTKVLPNGAGPGIQLCFSHANNGYSTGGADDLYFYPANNQPLYTNNSNLLLEAAGSSNETMQAVLILRPKGSFFFVKGGRFTDWTLVGVYSQTSNNVYATAVWKSNTTSYYNIDDFTLLQLGAPFNSESGYAAGFDASAADGDTITMAADGFLLAEHTIVSGETFDIQFRRTDDNNCWIMRFNQTAQTLKLFEKQSGTETERKTAAWNPTVGAKYLFYIKTNGNTIEVDSFYWNSGYSPAAWANSLQFFTPYTSASFNNTATGAKVSGGSASNFASYPRNPGASAIAEINKLNFS